MVRMLAAILGAVALIRASSWSLPLGSYLSLHGLPKGHTVAQPVMMLVKPMTLPSICMVTTVVSALKAVSCAGFVPLVVLWGWVMSEEVAPEQDTSVSESPRAD